MRTFTALLWGCGSSEPSVFGGPALEDAVPEVGASFAQLVLPDARGDLVDLYDFGRRDRPVMVVLTAKWSGGSNGLAAWIAGHGDANGWLADYPRVPELVDSGAIVWVDVHAEDADGDAPDAAEIAAWDEAYHHPLVPVLGGNPEIGAVYAADWPAMYWLDEDLRIGAISLDAMDAAQAY